MKKHVVITIALFLIALTLCACARSSEKMVEKMIEDATGQNVEIKDDGNSFTIKGNDGESATINVGDGQKWPAGKLGDLPELMGKVKSVIEAGGTCYVSLEDVSRADAEAYVQKLKGLGYTGGTETTDEDTHMFMFFGSKSGAEVVFSYYPEGGSKAGMSSVDITYASKQQE